MSTKNEALKQDVLAKSRRIIMGDNLDNAIEFVNSIIMIVMEHPEMQEANEDGDAPKLKLKLM